jgi:hypothetical protein
MLWRWNDAAVSRSASGERIGRWSPPTTKRGSASSLSSSPDAVDRFRAGEQDAFDVDEILHHYQRAARELWKFCWLAGGGAGIERTARLLRDMAAEGESIDWWARGALPERRVQRPAGVKAGSSLAPETRPENPTSS